MVQSFVAGYELVCVFTCPGRLYICSICVFTHGHQYHPSVLYVLYVCIPMATNTTLTNPTHEPECTCVHVHMCTRRSLSPGQFRTRRSLSPGQFCSFAASCTYTYTCTLYTFARIHVQPNATYTYTFTRIHVQPNVVAPCTKCVEVTCLRDKVRQSTHARAHIHIHRHASANANARLRNWKQSTQKHLQMCVKAKARMMPTSPVTVMPLRARAMTLRA